MRKVEVPLFKTIEKSYPSDSKAQVCLTMMRNETSALQATSAPHVGTLSRELSRAAAS